MVNALYDFNGLTPWFVPYIGAGVGYLGISEKWHTNNNLTLTVPPGGLSAAGQTFLPGTVAVVWTEHEGRIRIPGDPRRRHAASDRHAWLGGDA